MPDTLTWTTYEDDGTIVNTVYALPTDPVAVANILMLLGIPLMKGTVTRDELMRHHDVMPKGEWEPGDA